MVAPVVSDPLHIPAVLQRAEQTKSRTFHQTQAAADFSEAEGMIGVPEQFEDIKRPAHDADAVAGCTGITRCVEFHVAKLGFYFEAMLGAGGQLVKRRTESALRSRIVVSGRRHGPPPPHYEGTASSQQDPPDPWGSP